MKPEATRLIRHPNGALTRVPARIMAPQRIKQSDVERFGSYQQAKQALWGNGGRV